MVKDRTKFHVWLVANLAGLATITCLGVISCRWLLWPNESPQPLLIKAWITEAAKAEPQPVDADGLLYSIDTFELLRNGVYKTSGRATFVRTGVSVEHCEWGAISRVDKVTAAIISIEWKK